MQLRRAFAGMLPLLAVTALVMTGCRDDFGGYYEQPGWIEGTSAEVLGGRSDCKTYLSLVEKTLFAKQIEGSGQYTFLVPTDAAFDAFFADNPYGYKSVEDIPDDVAARMVSSWMLYNSYPCDSIASSLLGFDTWDRGAAFKHQTPSYDVLRRDVVKGREAYVYETSTGAFSLSNNAPSWHNYRYLPVFTDLFLSKNAITTDDWRQLVGTALSPYGNYIDAAIIDAGNGSGDLYCQNGVIHLVDKVVMPLENMDAIIRTYADGSAPGKSAAAAQGAWSLLGYTLNRRLGSGEYQFLEYTQDATATHYFEKAYPELDLANLQLRNYRGEVNPFRLNVEAYTSMAATTLLSALDLHYDNYNGGMTFYVPTTSTLKAYIQDRLFQYVGAPSGWDESQEAFDAAFAQMSDGVLPTLWQSLQSDGIIWPSQFAKAENSIGQTEHIDGYASDKSYERSVVASGFASNALWNVIDFVPKTAAFEGVGSRMILDPAYSYEEQIITETYANSIYGHMLASELSGKGDVDMSIILWGDENARWWDDLYYNAALSAYVNQSQYNAIDGTSTTATTARNGTSRSSQLNTTVTHNYIEREKVDALDMTTDRLGGAYGGWSYTNTASGDVVRYRMSGGSVDGQPEIQVQSSWNIAQDEAERAMYTSYGSDHASMPAAIQQTEPTAGSYMSVYKDPTYSDYINGSVYLAARHTEPSYYNLENTYGDGRQYYAESMSVAQYLKAYLIADSLSENPQHTLFKRYWDYASDNIKNATASISIGSGFWTIFVPTDAAMQFCIDRKLIFNIEGRTADNAIDSEGTYNYVDSACYVVNAYITKSGCYPDDGLSAFYEPSEAWAGIGGASRQAASHYLVTTNNKITDLDRVVGDNVVRAWEALISGATMSGYVDKVDAGYLLQYTGRPYTSGAYQCVNVYNGNENTDGQFDNCVVREAGQSNIICQHGIIHSLNGFVVYKIASR